LACLERRSYGEPALLKSGVEPGEGGQMPGKKYLSNANTTKEGFTGKERDKHSGLDYFGARYYDPAIGRFLAIDPLDFKFPDKTPFHYVSNNPINLIDPTGMEEEDEKKKKQEEKKKKQEEKKKKQEEEKKKQEEEKKADVLVLPFPITDSPSSVKPKPTSSTGLSWLSRALRAVGRVAVRGLLIFAMTGTMEAPGIEQGIDNLERDIDDIDNPEEFPENPDEWLPPPGVAEEPKARENSPNGKNRQWTDENGNIVRRWDQSGRHSGKERGPHWHDSLERKVHPGRGLMK
jgi:RHS repeat-associated protein